MPRAEEMIEKVDLRDHAPATDAADLTIAAVHPGSFWRDQAEARRADDDSGDHPAAGDRVAQGEGAARASQPEAVLHDSEGLSESAGQEPGSPIAAAPDQQGSPGSADQEAPALQAPASAGAGFGLSGAESPALAIDEAGAEIPAALAPSDVVDAAPPLAEDIATVPIPELAPVLSGVLGALEGATGGVTEVLPEIVETAGSALPLAATVVEPVGDIAPGLLEGLFQSDGAGDAEVAGLDLGDLQPLDSGAVDNIAEEATSALPLTDTDALLGSGDQGGPMDGLLDL